jgi:hypothetical protein
MPFIKVQNQVISFATREDVEAIDRRIFESNEGLTDETVDGACIRATERIIDAIQTTTWWKTYWIQQSGPDASAGMVVGINDITVPAPNPTLILGSQNDFTDMTVYFALSEYILPSVADFGNPDNAERQKIGFYNEKYRVLFQELIDRGDWYDFSASGTITMNEKAPTRTNIVRVR